jgi:MFS transporter, OFA family, oxalate/formate antiporter
LISTKKAKSSDCFKITTPVGATFSRDSADRLPPVAAESRSYRQKIMSTSSPVVNTVTSSSVALPVQKTNRWLIAGMGTLLQLCLGSVYAWSYFQKPLVDAYGWSNTQVAWTFSFAIGFLGIAAAIGGVLLPKFGPRKLAVTGALLYGAGHLIAALALHLKMLALLWLGYGVIGGIGLGLGYVTPVATAAKWFPDKKGLVTGMVVMGFGFGALLMSKVIAPALMAKFALPEGFAGIGVAVGVTGLIAASFLKNPPAAIATATGEEKAVTHLLSGKFALMWLVFFCNIVAGIAIIGFQSPLMQDLWKKVNPSLSPATLAAYGATLIATSSVFNGLGRFSWGALSDRWGQLATFRLMLATQMVAFVALMFTGNPWLFGALICYVLLCYGGGFGVMPSFVLNTFGQSLMAVLYGCILTAWAAGGIVGPQVIAVLKDHCGAKAALYSFGFGASLLALGLIFSLLLRSQKN